MTPVQGLDGLPERVAAVRRELGLSQRVFGERIGVTRNVVIRYERGHPVPSARTLDRIAKFGGVTAEWEQTERKRRRYADSGGTVKAVLSSA